MEERQVVIVKRVGKYRIKWLKDMKNMEEK
jgi:hypothetical protein